MEAQNWKEELDRREARFWKLEEEHACIRRMIEEVEGRIRRDQRHTDLLRSVAAHIQMEMQVAWMGGDSGDLD
jgi:hypothetical protein